MVELSKEFDGLDDRLRSDLLTRYDTLLKVIDSALEAKKKVRVSRNCAKCQCKHIEYVEVENIDAALKAAEYVSTRAFGRPNAAKDDSGDEERIVFKRLVKMD